MTSNTWLSALKEYIEEENINIHNTDDDYREEEGRDVWAGDDRNVLAGENFTEYLPAGPTKPTKATLAPSKNTETLDRGAYKTYKRSGESAATSDTVNDRHPLDCACLDCSARPPRYAKPIEHPGEVLDLARQYFGPVEDPVIPPPLPGRDPIVKRRTDKAEFFMGDWREAQPQDFKVYKGGKA